MRILFTGASSFTGYWFIKLLAAAGHEVHATYQGQMHSYEGLRKDRVSELKACCIQHFECSLGSGQFVQVIEAQSEWDVFCHHAADVTNYHSSDFDINKALASNTHMLRDVLACLSNRGCKRFVLTGSVFEPNEGSGSDGLPAFSAYGVSKAATALVADLYARMSGMHLGKFVIPNPFGPYEEPRFTAYLVRTWAQGKIAGVKTPEYVRDNIHVELLAACYEKFVGELPNTLGQTILRPSGYIENQGRFAERFADALRTRTELECGLDLANQTDFEEPRIRINTDPATQYIGAWSEEDAWDSLANYYATSIAEISSGS